jgi:hypothetical protein
MVSRITITTYRRNEMALVILITEMPSNFQNTHKSDALIEMFVQPKPSSNRAVAEETLPEL